MRLINLRKNNLFNRLFIRFLLISLLIIVIFGFSMIYFFKGFYYDKREEEIIQNSYVMMDYIKNSLVEEERAKLYQWLKLTANINSGQAWIIDNEGYHIISYPSIIEGEGDEIRFLEFDEVLEGEVISQRVEAVYFERPMLLVSMPIIAGDNIEGALLIFTSVAGINSTIRQVQQIMIASSLLAVILAMIVAYLWSKSLARPLKKLSNTAIELSEGNFGQQVDIEAKGEIDNLVQSINYLSTKLDTTIKDLVEEKNKLKYILTEMEEGVLVINLEGNVLLINDSAKRLLNLNDNDLNDKKLEDLVINNEIKQVFLTAKEEDQITGDEFFLEGDEFKKRILLNCTPIHIAKQELWGVVGLFNDISERWRFEKLQQDFVANVSHELKTPLASIKGSTEILLDGIIQDKSAREDYLKIILEETDRLSGLVNEILNLSEIGSESLQFDMEKMAVKDFLADLIFVFNKSKMGEERELVLKRPEEEVYVYASKEKLKQVLLNFLDNAYKFSELNSKIELGCEVEGDRLKFWVRDEGCGIPEEDLKNIWERFYKVDKAHTPNKSGSGLGLAIAKQIILEHDGDLFAQSKLDQGSTFGFYLNRC